MPDVTFWSKRFDELGVHSVGPGDTSTEAELERHRLVFRREIQPYLAQLKGPVLDFGCGVGRWVMDLPRPYLGLDLTPQHIEVCKERFSGEQHTDFQLAAGLGTLPDKSLQSIFTVTVLQHIVETDLRREIFHQFSRVLRDDGLFLSVEWAEGQREYDWCTAVRKAEYLEFFRERRVGTVNHHGRFHGIWLCTKKRRGLLAPLAKSLRLA